MKIKKGDKFICKNGKKGLITYIDINSNTIISQVTMEQYGESFSWCQSILYNTKGLTDDRDLKEFDIEEIINWEVLNL